MTSTWLFWQVWFVVQVLSVVLWYVPRTRVAGAWLGLGWTAAVMVVALFLHAWVMVAVALLWTALNVANVHTAGKERVSE